MAHSGPDWSDLVVAAGLDPHEVEMTVVKKRRRHGSRVQASHPARGLACEAESCGSTDDNAAAAISGLVDLLSGGATHSEGPVTNEVQLPRDPDPGGAHSVLWWRRSRPRRG
jgi:hypothetical protein